VQAVSVLHPAAFKHHKEIFQGNYPEKEVSLFHRSGISNAITYPLSGRCKEISPFIEQLERLPLWLTVPDLNIA